MEKGFVTEEVCKFLESNKRKDRYSGLSQLQDFCESAYNNTDEFTCVYEKCFLHILKCYSDKLEICREKACLIIDEFIKKLPNNENYIRYVVSTIAKQIGQEQLNEKSEEIRLLMVSQLREIITTFGDPTARGDPLFNSYNDIIDVLRMRLADTYPAVQREACECVKAFATKSASFHYRAEVLSAPLISLTNHKLYLNRIAGIHTLRFVALNVKSNAGCISRIIDKTSPKLLDQVPAVRAECGIFGCRLMIELKNRYSLFEKLIPFALCCVGDQSIEVQEAVKVLWIKCGQLYFEENKAELNKFEIDDNPPENYPENAKRPSLGCRAIVQRHLSIVELILRKLSESECLGKLYALKVLWQIALHAEITLTPKFMEIISHVAPACSDPDFDVAVKAMEVGNLLGYLLPYKDWFPQAFEKLENHPNLGYLKLFYAMYATSKECSSEDINNLVALLTKDSFTLNIDKDFQFYVVKLAMVLCTKYYGEKSSEAQVGDISLSNNNTVQENLYIIVFKVKCLCHHSNLNVLTLSEELLAQLTKEGQPDYLHQNYVGSLLRSLDLDFEVDDSCLLIELLDKVIRDCGFRHSAMDEYRRCIKSVWRYGTDEAKIRIMEAVRLAMISWDETLGLSGQQNLDLLKTFFNDLIIEHLEWKAGCTAEVLRSLAVSILHTITKHVAERTVIQRESLKYYPNLIQDNSVSTRVYILKVLYRSPTLNFDQYKEIVNAVLPRLDDLSYDVRKWAAAILGRLHLDESENQHQEEVRGLAERTLSVLRRQLGGPEPKLREAAKASIRAIKRNFPELGEIIQV